MRHNTRYVGVVLVVIALWPLGCARGPDEANRMAVAEAYFAYLRDLKVEKAQALVAFEDYRARKEWERQVQAYAERREAGGREWWGSPMKTAGIPDEQDFGGLLEVEWRYRTDDRWETGAHHTYRMRTVNGKWRVVVDHATAQRGTPWVPADEE